MTQKNISETQLKIREGLLACIFIGNKSQKLTKWRKLDAVLEAAYNTFYPGAQFDRNKEEGLVLEEKVVSAEAEILDALDYDVFWRGFDWIVTAAKESGRMDPEVAKDALPSRVEDLAAQAAAIDPPTPVQLRSFPSS